MVMSIIYAVSCVLMIIGSCSYGCLRGLMLPYLILQLVFNIIISTCTITLQLALLIMSKFPTANYCIATIVLILSCLYAAIISMARVYKKRITEFLWKCIMFYFLFTSWALMAAGNSYTIFSTLIR